MRAGDICSGVVITKEARTTKQLYLKRDPANALEKTLKYLCTTFISDL